MERIPCEPSVECKYFPECFEDVHHYYKQCQADTPLKEVFCRLLPENRRVNCRRKHEEYEEEYGWVEYPPDEVMLAAVSVALQKGIISLSKKKRRNIYGR